MLKTKLKEYMLVILYFPMRFLVLKLFQEQCHTSRQTCTKMEEMKEAYQMLEHKRIFSS